MCDNVDDILEGRTTCRSDTSTDSRPFGVFYSITNSMRGLQGLQLASVLLFLAMEKV